MRNARTEFGRAGTRSCVLVTPVLQKRLNTPVFETRYKQIIDDFINLGTGKTLTPKDKTPARLADMSYLGGLARVVPSLWLTPAADPAIDKPT